MVADELDSAVCHPVETAAASEREEERLRWVVVVTLAAMLGELVVGLASGSLALVAEGWHMACHAGALGLSAIACWYARTRARNASFTFGTGKVHALAGYTNAVLLIGVALFTIVEAARRLSTPVTIDVRDALPVAIIGLVVNAACVGLLHQHEEHGDHDHNHNVRAAYLHVLSDLVTSLAAIAALLGTRFARLPALDPLMAILSSLVVLRWGVALCNGSGRQLLDVLASSEQADAIRRCIESIDDARVVDLRLWAIGPRQHGCIVSIVTSEVHPLDHYRGAIRAVVPVEHLTIEVSRCDAPSSR
jgi:cation diffusion facilitator family transporter